MTMRTMMIALAPLLAAAAPHEAHDAAAVIATDDAWLQAEIRGDGDYLDGLLMDGYRSVGDDGKVTSKADLVDHARTRGNSPDTAARVAKWKAEHPTHADVTISGDTAVLTWISAKPGAGAPVSSCDIFVYADGRWRALYSHHTAAAT
jgi:hypothetical protein